MSDKLVQLFKDANKTRTFMDKVRANIVDVAGRQRMLTQKMTKEKLLIISKIDEKENKKKLKNTISVFDSSLNMLIKGNPQKKIATPTDKNIKEQLKKVSSIWSKLKPIYSSDKVGKKELSTIISQNPILLKEMDKVVKMSEIVADY
jgi:methyl-accepting chemotaxis protein